MRVAGILAAVAVSWVVIAVANVRSDEPQPAALAIVLACFALTIAEPKLAIVWVAIFAGAIPLSYAIAAHTGIPALDPPPNLVVTAVALIPAIVGTAAAHVTRVILRAGP